MSSNHHLPASIKEQLDRVDSTGEYSGALPKITSTSKRTYYVKAGTLRDAEQWAGEAESLKEMERASPGIAPKLYSFGNLSSGNPYFISEYKVMGHLNSSVAVVLAKRLATELHQFESAHGFGFQVPTYCGPTRFANGWFDGWSKCYAAMYGTLIQRLRETGRHERLCSKGDKIIQRCGFDPHSIIPILLGKMSIQPVLLHGDLWNGNVGVDQTTGEPVIFDPASFYGHSESDLAIARIFGGFPQSFYDTYFKNHPKSEPQAEYPVRAELYESFHYLNHTVIFGVSAPTNSGCKSRDKVVPGKLRSAGGKEDGHGH
uniref:protein-ribulosamine 3-kinase n=1 Tax=Coprinellus disseminatus TaxID=71703 RepID=Q1WMR2_COPDI|nr:possible fructosamine-3-kinase [Coprinellus disseminatus]